MNFTNNFGCTLNFHSLYFCTLLLACFACFASTSRSPVCWANGDLLIKKEIKKKNNYFQWDIMHSDEDRDFQ